MKSELSFREKKKRTFCLGKTLVCHEHAQTVESYSSWSIKFLNEGDGMGNKRDLLYRRQIQVSKEENHEDHILINAKIYLQLT